MGRVSQSTGRIGYGVSGGAFEQVGAPAVNGDGALSEGEHAPPAPASQHDPEDDPLVGRVINDRFKIVAVLARGGMGKVYRAEQAPLGRAVALKILSPKYEGDRDPEFHKRFFLEASTCSKLTHPNTITIFDYGRTEDDVYYIAMELLEGRTLRRALRDEGPFAPERALHIARQICRSLREAHSLGVVHRDLKPANVFLVRHGDETDFVKVLDFGLVKELAENKGEDLTQTGLFMGSPKYMAPEQIRGEEVDGRADIYALGVLLFEMLTGKVPFDRPNSVNILMAHIHEAPPSFAEVAPEFGLDPGLEAIVMRCLAKDPLDRFDSMNDLLVALKQMGPSGLHSTSAEFGLSSEPGLHDASTGTFATQTGPTPRSSSPEPAEPPTAPEQAPTPSGERPKRWAPVAFVAVVLILAALVGGLAALRERKNGASRLAEAAPAPPAPRPDEPAATSNQDPPPEPRVMIRLRSEPPGARVVVGEHVYGPTPAEVEWVGDEARPGREVTFRFEREGYRDLTVTRSITGPTLEVTATLDPARAPSSMVRRPPRPRMTSMRAPEDPPPVGLKGYKAEPY